ncbi:MAG: hypothetical protein E5Y63_02145 [Mesorhizobium sp.]|nr:MAG: hypothetical protein E5Y63_02145 [Mesorhizobium sp.]
MQTLARPLIALLQPYLKAFSVAPSAKLPISPLAGEMSGRTEGGGKDHQPRLQPFSTGNSLRAWQVGGTAPPSALPGISPARGEIGCRFGFRQPPALEAGQMRAALACWPSTSKTRCARCRGAGACRKRSCAESPALRSCA